jgi:hypothetical protein
MPDVTYSITRGPFQHGETVVEGRLETRQIDMIVRQNGCDRDAYWDLRGLLDGILRPNRVDINDPSPGVLRRVLSNGDIRDLDCYVSKGPLYKMNTSAWDSNSLQEILRFTAYNPILYDPTTILESAIDFLPNPVSVQNLVFPFVFPLTFEFTYTIVSKSIAITYQGNWEEYPTLTITGPITNLKITHQELGAVIDFTPNTIPAGTIITIDLTYAAKMLIDNFGVSWIGKITDESALSIFRLDCDPYLPNSLNTITCEGILGDTNTRIDLIYKNRYIGAD